MFELIKDYNGNGIELKKGEYSKEQLIKIYNDEGRLNYCLSCTSLKEVLIPIKKSLKEKIVDKVEEVIDIVSNNKSENQVQEVQLEEPNGKEHNGEEIETIFIAKENLRKNNKVVFKKDDKITYEELEEAFGNNLKSIFDKLIETKVTKNVSI